MDKIHNSSLTVNSKKLRSNMTKEERHLWYDFLKKLPITFHRQKIIGKYIVDFYCASAKLIVELDGSQHFDSAGEQHDKIRDEYLQSFGFKILRYSNYEIAKNFNGVCQDIIKHLQLN